MAQCSYTQLGVGGRERRFCIGWVLETQQCRLPPSILYGVGDVTHTGIYHTYKLTDVLITALCELGIVPILHRQNRREGLNLPMAIVEAERSRTGFKESSLSAGRPLLSAIPLTFPSSLKMSTVNNASPRKAALCVHKMSHAIKKQKPQSV